ncbi:hypothetical protein F5Y04DRAFT_242116 [Hypomontagnella monticulosa]|nr:hypothetical protein F5Y04DRAFT_242116 [Hypomontagnella monticulosa]
MANLPSQYPHLALHLTDRAHTPLISSGRTNPQREALSILSQNALSAHESALRLGLGAPQRIMVEHVAQGPVLLQSFMRADTPSTAANSHNANTNLSAPSQPPTAATSTANGEPSVDGEAPADPASPTDLEAEAQTQVSPTSAVERRLQQLQLHGSTPTLDDSGAATPTPGGSGGGEVDANAPPMLIGVVVAPTPDAARHARRAAAQLEHVGRAIQARWAEAQQQAQEDGGGSAGAAAGDAGD